MAIGTSYKNKQGSPQLLQASVIDQSKLWKKCKGTQGGTFSTTSMYFRAEKPYRESLCHGLLKYQNDYVIKDETLSLLPWPLR